MLTEAGTIVLQMSQVHLKVRGLEATKDKVYRLSGFFSPQGFDFTADDTGVLALDILDDDNVTGVMVTLRGDETELTGTHTGSSITVSGSNDSFTLSFDPDGSDSSNDALLSATSGFFGTMTNASGTSDVIGTSCHPDWQLSAQKISRNVSEFNGVPT